MKPDLSIIIPALNEAETLPLLLDDLARQQELSFEVIVADGSSDDATCQVADKFILSGRLAGRCLVGPTGRGRQLNAGALSARAEWLLFLHADSRLDDVMLLSQALDFMRSQQQQRGSDAVAGRFSLRFYEQDDLRSFALFYYETKARLGRPGCIHGDQGLMINKSFFRQVGPFREDLPVMEDTSLAEEIRARGQWLLLPGEIFTSARRFQVEGIRARQTLNALMMNFLSIGWLEFFSAAPDIYSRQDRTKALQLLPFFLLIKKLMQQMPCRRKISIWLATGGYVRSQAWQIGLALDCRKAYRQNARYEASAGGWLNWFDCWFELLTNHLLGRTLTALLVRIWFSWQLNSKETLQKP